MFNPLIKLIHAGYGHLAISKKKRKKNLDFHKHEDPDIQNRKVLTFDHLPNNLNLCLLNL